MQFRRLFASLKFRIVAMAVLTGIVAALGTATIVLDVTQREVQRMLLANDRDDRERVAALMAGKLETLKNSLVAVARQARSEVFWDAHRAERLLLDQPVLGALFDVVFMAATDGRMLAHVERGRPSQELPSIADRDYFRRAMQSDQPVVSEPLRSKVTLDPVLVVAVPVIGADGRTQGCWPAHCGCNPATCSAMARARRTKARATW